MTQHGDTYNVYTDTRYTPPTKRSTYRVTHHGKAIRAGAHMLDRDLFFSVGPNELVLLLCTAQEAMRLHGFTELHELGAALVKDDVLCLTRFGILWIQGSMLVEVSV